MLTSIEIAQLLQAQRKNKKAKVGFDTALIGLGIALQSKKKRK